MVGIQGIGKTPDTANPVWPSARVKETDTKETTPHDEARISSEARKALEAQRLLQNTKPESDVREKQITKVREAIEQGTYKVQQVLLQVAAHVSKYVARTPQDGVSGQASSSTSSTAVDGSSSVHPTGV